MIHVSKSIKAGDEILISYVDNFGVKEKRKELIKGLWNFECDCTACGNAGEDSIKRRKQISSMDDMIYKAIST
eukprot:Pgem_evm1s4191